MADAARPIRILVAEARLVALRLFHAHACPIGLELVGNDHRQARAHTLSHLLAMAGDGHGAIGANRYEYQGVVDPAMWHRVGAVLRFVCGEGQPRKTDCQDQAHGRDRAEKSATAYVDQFEVGLLGVHYASPSDATCLIAARILV